MKSMKLSNRLSLNKTLLKSDVKKQEQSSIGLKAKKKKSTKGGLFHGRYN